MMRKWMLLLILALSIALLIFQIYKCALFAIEEDQAAANTYGSFHIETISSFDGQLRLEIDDRTPMIIINVFNEKDNALIYSFEAVRKWDFGGVCFEKDTYNIWIQSSDIGTICYEYDDGVWRYNPRAIRPLYIISK